MIMENNNDWFENLNYLPKDHPQQTFVTKHDLELLHKKIIATDLIVQKYQEANRALLRLQVDNDDLQKQIEQITNECCIFSKQVTECTQECDSLKEQIEISNTEKRELHHQIRLLQDENTSNHHEIMVLKQFESLKDTNEQLTKTVERHQKTIGKLQLQVQRKSPVVYKPVKNKQEPSETEIALTKSQKSILELRLALGRVVNFIQVSKIEIPTALRIRPVLKAHDITDDFLEIEGDIPRNPVTETPKPVVSQVDEDDDDDDDDQGDFIDVNPPIPPPPAPKADVIEKTPMPLRSQEKKSKAKKKIRRKKDASTSENTSSKLDELANELEMALSQSTDQPISSLTDDEDAHPKPSTSDNFQPIQTNSTITILKPTNFQSQKKFPSIPRQDKPVNKQSKDPLQVDSITPMEIETSNKRTHYMSFLSEDDDENNRSISSMSTQEYISPVDLIEPTPNQDARLPVLTDNPSSNQHMEIMSDPIPELAPQTNDRTTVSSAIPSKALDPKHREIVLRLLNILTQLPVPSEHLRLVRRRIPKKTIPEEPVPALVETEIVDEMDDSVVTEIAQKENPVSIFIDEPTTSIEDPSADQISTLIKPQLTLKEQMQDIEEHEDEQMDTEEVEDPHAIFDDIHPEVNVEDNDHMEEMGTAASAVEAPTEVEENPLTEQIHATINDMLMQRQVKFEEKNATVSERHEEPPMSMEDDHYIEDNNASTIETPQELSTIAHKGLNVTEIINKISEVSEEPRTSIKATPRPDRLKLDQNVTNLPLLHLLSKSAVPKEAPSMISTPQEPTPAVSTVPLERPVPPLVSEFSSKYSLQPFQISIVTRLLNTLITLPVKPIHFPVPFPVRRHQQKSVVIKPSISLSRQSSNRPSRSPTRMQTRSLNSIRACLARCNQPKTVATKRMNTESITRTSTSSAKRMKSNPVETNTDEYAILKQFLHSSTKGLNETLKEFLRTKLSGDSSSLINRTYGILREFLLEKCDLTRALIKPLQPYENSIKTLLTYLHNQSSIFQTEFIKKLNQTFEQDIKQEAKFHEQIIILNRLFIITCSIFAASPLTIYPRLFDIGYSLPYDILADALSYVSRKFPTLISNEICTKSSNILLHQVLFDILPSPATPISYQTLEKLLITYHTDTRDQHDLIRSFVLVFRHRTWSWCSNELCSKILFPTLEKLKDQSEHLTFLKILQLILLTYKADENFQNDTNFHHQLQQQLSTLQKLNDDECTVRENILSILCNPVLLKK